MLFTIKHREKLLQDLADGVKAVYAHKPFPLLGCIEVVFIDEGKEVLKIGLALALDYLVNDIYYNVETNWQNADCIIVRVI